MVAFARYLVSAGAATCVDVALVQILLAFSFGSTPLYYASAIVLGALCGVGVNFLFSRRFVFDHDDRSIRDHMISFLGVSATILALRLAVAFALLAVLSLPFFGWLTSLPVDAPAERFAHIGAVGIVTIYSFFAHKHVTFAGGILALFANKSAVRP